MQNSKQKKLAITIDYEEAFQKHMEAHQQKASKAGIPMIEQRQLNRRDRSQQFYKCYERQFKSTIVMKLGFKIAALEVEELDLALYCFSLLQGEAKFPIKTFIIEHSPPDVFSFSQERSRKDLWMETQIMVSSLLTNSREQHLFQTKIYKFFNEFLLSLLRQFLKEKINWDYMSSKEYTDERVILEFQNVVIDRANKYFFQSFGNR